MAPTISLAPFHEAPFFMRLHDAHRIHDARKQAGFSFKHDEARPIKNSWEELSVVRATIKERAEQAQGRDNGLCRQAEEGQS
ncbi:hypothetical protein HOP62_01575 [Halomonas sp. MCCC 1A17488]|uniref:hypothetical protein n=1 Tax=unclassified Halomonas TaxID=2609666 RepID=UPI0018D226C9|nr:MULTISPECIES: hypothetical protein [unclassified Halomonas]MCE8014764.1 hypothetical protein [Halomonas sp. MCCC 1A17488]MCG3238097.1 hypothetical protein [Halomonas sp. MCCC 1A17488]QPP48129.1 hypothetical protein I4484_12825 [Halomonas sp. SS10-MC5]